MRIPKGTVLLFFSVDAACPVGGVVESSDDGLAVIAVRDDVPAMGDGRERCEVRYTDPRDGRFMGVACAVESIVDGRVTVRPVGEAFPANQRGSFRVSMARSEIVARVGAHSNCEVIDVSETGLRVRTPGVLTVGEAVEVSLRGPGVGIEGMFTVKRVQEQGTFSCVGLLADQADAALARGLVGMVAAMQRAQLRRRSRVAAGGAGSAGAMPGEAGEAEQEAGEKEAWVRVPASVLADRALPGSLRHEDGSVVASRGEVLSMDELSRLGESGLFACEDWASQTGAAPSEPDDRRTSGRSVCAGTVRVVALRGDRVLRLRGELVDISRSGVGLRTPTLLEPDAYVVVDFSTAGKTRWIIGRVVHGEVGEGETSCRLGVRFSQNATQSGPVPDSVPDFGEWVSVKAIARERRQAR